MKEFLVFAISTLNFLISYSQEKNFLLNRPLLSSVDSIEKVNKGEEFIPTFTISVSKDYFPNADIFDLATPLIFFRKGNTFSTEMNYYFSLPDSTIRLISYSWEGTPKLSDELNALFETNADYFLKHFGHSGEIKNETHDTWAQKSLTWENDIVHVYQFIVSGKNTNRVRVLISWK